jgi:Zn-dependent protease
LDPIARALLTAGAIFLVLLLFGRARLVLSLYRVRLSGLEDDTAQPGPITPFEQAAIGELEALGFAKTHEWTDTTGTRPARVLFFAHAQQPAFAELQLRGSTLFGYPVFFFSFEPGRPPLSTINRIGWFEVGSASSMNTVDARVDTLEAHWAAHCARSGAASAMDPSEAARIVREAGARMRADSLARGLWVRGRDHVHLSLASAIRVAVALRRERPLLSRPYRSPVTTGDFVVPFLCDQLAAQERQDAGRSGSGTLKAAMLLASMVLGLVLWGVVFDWQTAVVLVGVLLVHESGHALAMRAFGWSDLHMFFVPFMGAVVTGGRPRELPAWKETIVLLAGPVPGLVAGLVVLAAPWAALPGVRSAALMAVIVNAFNLLPLTPLDGGRLVEIALFSRWPRARIVFSALSVVGLAVVAFRLESAAVGAIAFLMAMSFRHQLALAGLEHAVIADRTPGPLEERVCRVVVERRAGAGAPVRLALSNAILQRRRIRPARGFESAAILVALAVAWWAAAPSVALVLQSTAPARHAAPAVRSADQEAFDRAWRGARPVQVADEWNLLLVREQLLKPGDPRHRDIDWLRTQMLSHGERAEAVDRWLAGGGDGHFERRDGVLRRELDARFDDVSTLPPVQRILPLRTAIAWADGLRPQLVAPTIAIRLRLAESTDLAGDVAAARRQLADAARLAEHADDCACERVEVARAHAWFALSHDLPGEALEVLEAASPALVGGAPDDRLAIDHAWARLLAGTTSAGLAEMRAAYHAEQLEPGHRVDDDFDAFGAMDLAVALSLAGRADEARALALGPARQGCDFDARPARDVVDEGPWQALRMRRRAELAMRWCAAPAADRPAER